MDIPTHSELVERIDAFLARHPKIATTRFGRDVSDDPNLIPSIREGRDPKLGTLHKLVAYMAEHDSKLSDAPADPSATKAADLIRCDAEGPAAGGEDGDGQAPGEGPRPPFAAAAGPTTGGPPSRSSSEWPVTPGLSSTASAATSAAASPACSDGPAGPKAEAA